MFRENNPLYFLNIGRVYPRIERRVLSSLLDKMLFNNIIVKCAHYIIYLELGLGRYSNNALTVRLKHARFRLIVS